jgi:hypothetical protein
LKFIPLVLAMLFPVMAFAQQGLLYVQGGLEFSYSQLFGDFDGDFTVEGVIDTTDFLPSFDEGVGGYLSEADSTGSQMLLSLSGKREISGGDTSYHAFGLLYRPGGLVESGSEANPTATAQFFFLYGMDSLAFPTELPDSLDITEILGAISAEQKIIGFATSLSLQVDPTEISFDFAGLGLPLGSTNPLEAVSVDGGSCWMEGVPMNAVDEAVAQRPAGLNLVAAPNPFNPVTRLSWTQPVAAEVVISVFDLAGKKVYHSVGSFAQGPAGHTLDASALATGHYFVLIETAGYAESKVLLLVK